MFSSLRKLLQKASSDILKVILNLVQELFS